MHRDGGVTHIDSGTVYTGATQQRIDEEQTPLSEDADGGQAASPPVPVVGDIGTVPAAITVTVLARRRRMRD